MNTILKHISSIFCQKFFHILLMICWTNLALLAQEVDLLKGKKYIKLPFQLVQGFIVLDVVYEGVVPMKFIFDTGAQHTVLFERIYADSFNAKYSKRINLMGADVSSTFYALVLRQASLEVSGVLELKKDILVLEEDFVKISELIGVNVNGIIGGDIFKNNVLEIDFDKLILKISRCEHSKDGKFKDYQVLPVEVESSKLYLSSKICLSEKDTIIAKFLIDTGAALTSMIQTNSHPSLKLPEKVIKNKIGQGIGGFIEGYIGKVSHMSFGDFKFQNFISYFQDTESFILDQGAVYRNGVIGSFMLQRFKIGIDYGNKKLYLKPINKKYNTDFKYDKSGLTIYAYGDKLNIFIVKNVIPNSPAAEAGIEENDQIVGIGWLPIKYYSLEDILDRLSNKSGKKIKIKVKRGNEVLKKTIVLRDLL